MILVTGASGYVGHKAIHQLSAMGHRPIAMARDAAKARSALPSGTTIRIADYENTASIAHAFEGVGKLLFIASEGDAQSLMRQHANVITAAAAAHIGHLVFLGIIDVDAHSPFYFAEVYRDAERRIAGLSLNCTILRCGLYADFVLSHWVEPAISTGGVSIPVGEARIAPVTRDDVAKAAVAALLSPHRRGVDRCSVRAD